MGWIEINSDLKEIKTLQWTCSGGSSISQGAQPIILQNVYQKLYKNERIWFDREARIPDAPWIRH